MIASALPTPGLTVNNPDRHIERVLIEQKDVSLFNKKGTIQRITEELESSVIATSTVTDKAQQIENILYSKESYIKERNSIIDNLFKYYNPLYRHTLRKIDTKLDELDLQLYALESETKQIEADLDRAIESAQARLKDALEASPTMNCFKK